MFSHKFFKDENFLESICSFLTILIISWTSRYFVLLISLGNISFKKSEVSEFDFSIFDAKVFADLDRYDLLSFDGKYSSFGSNFPFFECVDYS